MTSENQDIGRLYNSPPPWKAASMQHLNGEWSFEIQHGTDGEVVCTMDSADQDLDTWAITRAPLMQQAIDWWINPPHPIGSNAERIAKFNRLLEELGLTE